MFKLPKLPFKYNELKPFLSKEQIKAHYKGHHFKYINKINELTQELNYGQRRDLETLIISASSNEPPYDPDTSYIKQIYHNAAQAWNHDFYWKCLSPKGGKPQRELYDVICRDFGNYKAFKDLFISESMDRFGSGWGWLAKDEHGKLLVYTTLNADCPLTRGHVPLLCIDLWEHAFYIDYRWKRDKYIHNFFSYINWDFAEQQFKKD